MKKLHFFSIFSSTSSITSKIKKSKNCSMFSLKYWLDLWGCNFIRWMSKSVSRECIVIKGFTLTVDTALKLIFEDWFGGKSFTGSYFERQVTLYLVDRIDRRFHYIYIYSPSKNCFGELSIYFLLETVISPTQVLSVSSLTFSGFRYCREVGQLNCWSRLSALVLKISFKYRRLQVVLDCIIKA